MAVEEIQREKKPERNASMAKQDHDTQLEEDTKDSPPVTAAWGTWEELVLASAVNRYGTKSWDFISSEIRKRSTAPILLTPLHCQQKFQELKRRFAQSDDDDVDMDDGSDTTTTTTAIPWLEELRKLRVVELQRQLQNYDLNIASLQLKVKKLTEENDKNGGATKKKSDLGQRNDEIEYQKEEEAKNDTPEAFGDEVPGDEESDRDNQSVNGSNGNLEAGVEKSENEIEASPVRTGDEKPESTALSPVREDDSCNVRPESKEPVKAEPDGEASEAPESIAESKSEGTMKDNSDVQSSASKSRKERSDRVRRGSRKGDERENEESTDSIPVRSLPLVDFLRKVQKIGSAVFDRRLDRQEKMRYKNLIRQHIDLEILQMRLKEGWYSDGNEKFFRDLLLLITNTRVFFPKESPESIAASDLRELIIKEMTSKRKQITDSKLPEKQSSSKPTNLPPKRASEPPDSLLLKPKLAGSMIVCRKRSSITAKAAGGDRRREPVEENQNSAKKTEDSKKKGKNVQSNEDENVSDVKNDKKKKKPSDAEEKKQSAAKFLNRMKRSSDVKNEPLLNTLKSVAAGGGSDDGRGGGGGGGEQKRGGGGNKGGNGKKEQAPKRNSGGRQLKEQGSPAKRSVGRPPKRAAAPPPMAAVLGKRNRESMESETLGSKQTKKRSKR